MNKFVLFSVISIISGICFGISDLLPIQISFAQTYPETELTNGIQSTEGEITEEIEKRFEKEINAGEKVGEKVIEVLKNNLKGVLSKWKDIHLKITKYWKENILPKIQSWYEKKESEIEEEFKKEKDEMRESIKNIFSGFWQLIKELIK